MVSDTRRFKEERWRWEGEREGGGSGGGGGGEGSICFEQRTKGQTLTVK